MALDRDFEQRVYGWGGRRTKRKPFADKSVLHVEIEGANHDNLRKMADAAGICVGEMVDKMVSREVRRRMAREATGFVGVRACIETAIVL